MKNPARILLLSALTLGIAPSDGGDAPPDAERVIRTSAEGSGMFYGLDGRWVRNQSTVTVKCTDRELIVAIRAFFPRGESRRCAGNAAEPLSLFAGEHTELLIVPGTEQRVYYHFAVTPDNRLYRARRRDSSWTAEGIRITASSGTDSWDSEYRIPFAALGQDRPAAGTVWRINFCRLSAAVGGETVWSSWNHSGSYHDISTMGALIFGRERQSVPFVPIREVEMSDAELRLHLAGNSAWSLDAQSDGTSWIPGSPSPGLLTFRPRRPPRFHRLKSDGMITLKLCSPAGRHVELRSSIRSEVTDPLLPDQFYCPDDRVSCRINGKNGILRLLDAAGNEVRRSAVTDGSSVLDMKGLPPGNYILEYDDGASRTTRSIVRCGKPLPLPLPEGKLTCGARGFRRGGQPFYLLGLAEEPDAGCFPFAPEFTYGQHRGLARGAVKLGSVPGGRIIRVTHLSRLLHERKRQEADFENFFRELRVCPDRMYRLEYEAGLALYFGESQESMKPCSDQPGWYRELGKTAKRLAPDILTSIHLDSQSQLAEYAQAADVLEFSDWTASFAEDDMMRHLRGALYRLRSTVPDKPTIFWLGGSIPDGRRRTPEELRAGIYLSLLAGCAGNIIHTGHGNIPAERTRMWSFLCGITREIAGFYPQFIGGETLAYPLPGGFTGRAVRLADGEIMLVAVNLLDNENVLKTPAGTRIFTPYEPAVIRWRDAAR
ncbi:MAG: hypothetical protein MR051_05820 [Lentisphaeria bacterium]|nr:hypothetical protein [Lentisphaeria bacterium]